MENFKANDDPVALVLPSLFTSEFTASSTGSPNPLGRSESKVCRVWWSNAFCMIQESNVYEHSPIFSHAGDSGDYTPEGNLIQWRDQTTSILFSSETNVMWKDSTCYVVTTNSTIEHAGRRPAFYHFTMGNHNSIYLFGQLVMACGRGFAQYLTNIASLTDDSSHPGFKRVLADGEYGPFIGTWNLVCDQRLHWLVREASFTVKNTSKPIIVIANSGTASCANLTLADSGSFSFNEFTIQFQILNIEKVNSEDQDFRREYRNIMDELDHRASATNADIWNYSR